MHTTNSSVAPYTTEESAQQIATLGDDLQASHVAEHIRGMVAATMAHLPKECSDAARHQATHWQQWALEAASGLEQPVVG